MPSILPLRDISFPETILVADVALTGIESSALPGLLRLDWHPVKKKIHNKMNVNLLRVIYNILCIYL
jgi:hypothetical protein